MTIYKKLKWFFSKFVSLNVRTSNWRVGHPLCKFVHTKIIIKLRVFTCYFFNSLMAKKCVEGFSRQIISNYFIFLIFVVVVVFYFHYNNCIENYLDAIFTYFLRKIKHRRCLSYKENLVLRKSQPSSEASI